MKLIVSYVMLDAAGQYLFDAGMNWDKANILRLRKNYERLYCYSGRYSGTIAFPLRFFAVDVLGNKHEIPLDYEAT